MTISRSVPRRFTSTLWSKSLSARCGAGRERGGVRGAVHREVEPAPALVDREAEPLQPALVGDRQRHQRRGRAAGGLDRVGEILEAADGAGHGDHLRAARRRAPGRRRSRGRGWRR